MQKNTSVSNKQAAANGRISATLQNFDNLADSASVRVSGAAAVCGCSVDTIWRWAKDGRLTARKIGPKVTVFNVGEIRRLLSAS